VVCFGFRFLVCYIGYTKLILVYQALLALLKLVFCWLYANHGAANAISSTAALLSRLFQGVCSSQEFRFLPVTSHQLHAYRQSAFILTIGERECRQATQIERRREARHLGGIGR
jgi:hypothetical protein